MATPTAALSARCDIMCAVLAAARDDLWRELEGLYRERALRPGRVLRRDLEAVRAQLAAAEREFARVRPRPAPMARSEAREAQPARSH